MLKANKQELTRNIQAAIGTFPSLAKIDTYIGRRHGTAAQLMAGIEPCQDGRAKRYYAGDVAARIMERY